MTGMFARESQKGADKLREVIMEDLESGTAVRPEAMNLAPGQITEAVKASLAETGAD